MSCTCETYGHCQACRRYCDSGRYHNPHGWTSDDGRSFWCGGDWPEPDRSDPDPDFHQSNHYDIDTPNRPMMRRG